MEELNEEKTDFTKLTYLAVLSITIVMLATVLKTLTAIILPVIFAILLSFVFMPVVRKMNKRFRIPWVLASILVTIFSVIVFFVLASILATSLTSILAQYPKYENKFMTTYRSIASQFNLEIDDEKSFLQNMWSFNTIRSSLQQIVISLSSGLVSLGKNFFMVFLLLALFLIELRLANQKISAAFVGNTKGKVLRISHNIIQEVTTFLSIKFFISLITGVLVGLFTWIIRVDFPIVWGFLAFAMNFIPIFGSIISTLATTLFTFIQFYPSYWQTIVVFLFMLVVNMGMGNIVEPKIEGENLGLSPFVILVSLSLWGYIWGFLGMLLAVPMMVFIKIVCENVPYLSAIAVLLGSGVPKPEKKTKVFSLKKQKENTTTSD